jgi:TatA/E family protein of Tat protein translocase
MPTPGPLELVIILVIALLILGPGKLPDVGAALGKSIREFRKASSDVQDAVNVNVDTSPLPATPPAAPAPTPAVQAPATPVAPVAPAAEAAPVAQATESTPAATAPTPAAPASAPDSTTTVAG